MVKFLSFQLSVQFNRDKMTY